MDRIVPPPDPCPAECLTEHDAEPRAGPADGGQGSDHHVARTSELDADDPFRRARRVRGMDTLATDLLHDVAAVNRCDPEGQVVSVADHDEDKCVTWVLVHVRNERVKIGELVPLDGDDHVARLQAGALCRAEAFGEMPEARDRRQRRSRCPRDRVEREQQHEREDHVRPRTGEGNQETPGKRCLAVAACLVGRVNLLEHGHADDPDVTAGGNGFDAVLGLSPAK